MLRSPFFSDLTEMETRNLAARSRKLFTLSAFYTANRALLEGIEEDSVERRIELAADYWRVVAKQFPTWEQVVSTFDTEMEKVTKKNADSAAALKAVQQQAESIGTGQ